MKLVFLCLSRRSNQYHKRKVVKHIVPNHSTTWLKSCNFLLDCCRLYCFTEQSAQPIIEHIFLFYWFIPLSRPPPLYCSSSHELQSHQLQSSFHQVMAWKKKIIKKKCKDHLLAKNVAHCAKHKLPVLNSFSPDSDSCLGIIN